jgi:hypothetical protein
VIVPVARRIFAHNAFISALVTTAALAAAGVSPPFAEEEILVSANVAEVGKGYRTSELRDRTIWNDRNERIGTIAEIVIGRGDVPFAILEVGGFLGLGAPLGCGAVQSLEDRQSRPQGHAAGRDAICSREISRVQVPGLSRRPGPRAVNRSVHRAGGTHPARFGKFQKKLTGIRAVWVR